MLKRRLASKVLFFPFSRSKPVRPNGLGEYQPSTITTNISVILGHVVDKHDWRFNMNKDCNFEDGLIPKLDRLFNERRESIGPAYGVAAQAELNGAEKVTDINLHVFDLSMPYDLQLAMMCVCGMTLGFRGCQEHADLDKRMIDRGNFEKGHPLEGKEFFAIKNMTRKTSKLSTRAVHVKTNKNARVPVDSYAGKIVETILRHLSPFQNRIYCQPLTSAKKARLPPGQKDVFYNHKKPIGRNTIRLMIKDACARLGFPDATGHGFRRLFITTLANDPGVSVEGSMKSSGHNSVAAQRTYMVTNSVSETNKFKALGLL